MMKDEYKKKRHSERFQNVPNDPNVPNSSLSERQKGILTSSGKTNSGIWIIKDAKTGDE